MEQIWLTGGTVTPEKLTKRAGVEERVSSFLNGFDYAQNDNTLMDGAEQGASCSAACAAGDTTDPRIGKWTSPNPKGHVYGAAVGMCVQTAAGVWCGIDDVVGATGIPGLYVAGDGANGCYGGGPNYGCRRGSTSNSMSLQGYRAGGAAAAHVDGVDAVELPAEKVAQNGHDLRLAHEVEHLILAMELKLRAGLECKESRGYHCRTDYPLHDDNYLFYITQTKNPDGGDPLIDHVELPARWVGDLSEPHEVRYPTFNTPEEYALYAPKDQA